MSATSLKWRTIVAYALPAIPISAIGLPLAVYVVPYYWTVVGSATVVGLVFGLVRLVDIVFDPFFGFVSDHTKTRWGRRRHWMVASAPVLMLGVYMFFNPPLDASWVYLALWATVVYLAFAVFTIAHASWGADLTPHYHERSRVQGSREFALVGGMLCVLILPSLIETGGAAEAAKVSAMGWFIIVLLPITLLIACFGVPEHDRPVHSEIDWKSAWRLVWANGPMKRVLFADLILGIAVSITASLYIVMIAHTFQLPNQSSGLLLIYFVSGLVGVPFWIWLSHKVGKHQTLAGACLYSAILLPMYFLAPRDGSGFWYLVVIIAAHGFAYGAGAFLLRSIMADVTDQETAETGQERMGVYFSFLILTNKLGYALAPALTFPIFDLIGFVNKPGAVNSPEAISGIVYVFVLIPVSLLLLTAAVLWRFPLDEAKQSALRSVIAARGFQAPSPSPAVAEPIPIAKPGIAPNSMPAE